MKLFLVPIIAGLAFVGCLFAINQIYVSAPAKRAAAAKSRASEARSLADKAQADEKTAAYAADLERIKGNNQAHIIATTALADVARDRHQENDITIAHIVSVFFGGLLLIIWRMLYKAEKKADKLEWILISSNNPRLIELMQANGITTNQNFIQGRI